MKTYADVNEESTLADLTEAMNFHSGESIRYGKLTVREHYHMGRVALLAWRRCKIEGSTFDGWIEEGGWTRASVYMDWKLVVQMNGAFDGNAYTEDELEPFDEVIQAYNHFRVKPPKPEKKVPQKAGNTEKQAATENANRMGLPKVAPGGVNRITPFLQLGAAAKDEVDSAEPPLNDPTEEVGGGQALTCDAATETFKVLRKLEFIRDRWPTDWVSQDAEATMRNLDDALALIKELKGKTP